MSHWMTSGASRLKARQNRTFASNAQQRAALAASDSTQTNGRGASVIHGNKRLLPGRRRRRVVDSGLVTAKKVSPEPSSLRSVSVSAHELDARLTVRDIRTNGTPAEYFPWHNPGRSYPTMHPPLVRYRSGSPMVQQGPPYMTSSTAQGDYQTVRHPEYTQEIGTYCNEPIEQNLQYRTELRIAPYMSPQLDIPNFDGEYHHDAELVDAQPELHPERGLRLPKRRKIDSSDEFQAGTEWHSLVPDSCPQESDAGFRRFDQMQRFEAEARKSWGVASDCVSSVTNSIFMPGIVRNINPLVREKDAEIGNTTTAPSEGDHAKQIFSHGGISRFKHRSSVHSASEIPYPGLKDPHLQGIRNSAPTPGTHQQVTTAYSEEGQLSPIRFFNNGEEVDMNGVPLIISVRHDAQFKTSDTEVNAPNCEGRPETDWTEKFPDRTFAPEVAPHELAVHVDQNKNSGKAPSERPQQTPKKASSSQEGLVVQRDTGHDSSTTKDPTMKEKRSLHGGHVTGPLSDLLEDMFGTT